MRFLHPCTFKILHNLIKTFLKYFTLCARSMNFRVSAGKFQKGTVLCLPFEWANYTLVAFHKKKWHPSCPLVKNEKKKRREVLLLNMPVTTHLCTLFFILHGISTVPTCLYCPVCVVCCMMWEAYFILVLNMIFNQEKIILTVFWWGIAHNVLHFVTLSAWESSWQVENHVQLAMPILSLWSKTQMGWFTSHSQLQQPLLK